MTLQELHYAFKINMDRVDKASSEDFNKAEIDWLLTEAQLLFIKKKIKRFPAYESNQSTIDDLSSLHIKYPLQGLITPIDLGGVYEVKTDSLAYKYLYLLRGEVNAVRNNCSYLIPLKFAQTDDLSEVLKDPFNGPSIDHIPYNFGTSSDGSGQSLYIYPGNYIINSMKLEYIKEPSRVFFGDYPYLDGTVPTQNGLSVTSELSQLEIVDMACQLASLNIENPEYISLRERKLTNHE